MFRAQLPKRPVLSPSVLSADFRSLKNYWTEGVGYEISQTEAQVLRDAAQELSGMFVEAMNYVTCRDDVLERFSVTGFKRDDRKIVAHAKRSWLVGQQRDYVLDRWDLAWDGIQPPKLLERNLGHLGLMIASGPVQEKYINWLKKRKGYTDATSFGDLRQAIVESFRDVAEEIGLPPREEVGVVVVTDHLLKDKELSRSGRFIQKCIVAAGYPAERICFDFVSFDVFSGRMLLEREAKILLGEIKKGKHFAITKLSSHFTAHQSYVYPYAGAECYHHSIARHGQRKVFLESKDTHLLFPDPKTTVLTPAWTILADNKAMLAVLHELFPDHPNLLPTYMGTQALQDEKRVVKLMSGMQGYDARIYNEKGKVLFRKKPMPGLKSQASSHYVTQAYSPAVEGPGDTYRVFNLFTANGRPAALGVREASGGLVGGANTGTRYLPVVVRSEEAMAAPGRSHYTTPSRDERIHHVIQFIANHHMLRI